MRVELVVNMRDFAGAERAFDAAARRFPQAELAILRLLRSSEAFRELCEELADADLALSNVPTDVASIRETRTREWQDLIDELVAEVEAALHKA
jgi:predicted lipid-binding transport protein (Tim44 family)